MLINKLTKPNNKINTSNQRNEKIHPRSKTQMLQHTLYVHDNFNPVLQLGSTKSRLLSTTVLAPFTS